MAVNKEDGAWSVIASYKDWQGKRRRKHKRGFKTKGEAKEWERDFLQTQQRNVDIIFTAFILLINIDNLMSRFARRNFMYDLGLWSITFLIVSIVFMIISINCYRRKRRKYQRYF